MKKIKFSNCSFYVFTICLMIVAVIVLAVTFSSLLSGYELSPHAQFRLWMTVFAFVSVAALALVRMLIDLAAWGVKACQEFFCKDAGSEESNNNNKCNIGNMGNMEYMS